MKYAYILTMFHPVYPKLVQITPALWLKELKFVEIKRLKYVETK
jgi:hypothetical protein